ncbi:glucose-1-phosphate thymidylyltransferase [Candidatus Gottesmanbacteria bacterium]|nr:glucose-1-phosphate thymidylyltransferase [Candidatus Gottesmanbacteria bacterium]
MEEVLPSYYFADIDKDFIFPEVFRDVKYVWEALAQKDKVLASVTTRNGGKVDPTVVMRGKVEIGEGTVIEPFCVIDGPAVIGKNCLIRPHVYIRAGTIISEAVVVGHGVEIKNSLIFKECKLDSHTFVGDSILGRGVRNGSGTITANRRFDQKEVAVKIKEKIFQTGLYKFGAVIGDYSRLGANCTLLPGTLIGQHVFVYPHSLVKGWLKSDIYQKTKQDKQVQETKERIILKALDREGNL